MPLPHDDSPRAFFRRQPGHAPTPLVELPILAAKTRVARVYVKDESCRTLGSFKSLGGTYAGLRALARATGATDLEDLLSFRDRCGSMLPTLLCASDGNHGLAVAAAAELAGASARVYLHHRVSAARAGRIAARGAEVVTVQGTYDDAVDEASRAARRSEGILVADTSADSSDPVVADVMAGYGVAAEEIIEQIAAAELPAPTHLFVQAGAGGLAAAMARGLAELVCRTVVVEPESAACVGAALRLGRAVRLDGDLQTAAEMLSCGEASAAAVAILQELQVEAMTVCEAALLAAPATLVSCGGPATTSSGATGLAGLLSIEPNSTRAQQLHLNAASRVLIIVTEAAATATP